MIVEIDYEKLNKKRMGSGVLFFNNKQELLIVNPTYKPGWSIPGGAVDDDESPRQAAIREVKEEIGIEIEKLDFICIDYQEKGDHSESLQFLFLGGELSEDQVNQIKLEEEELSEFKFASLDDVYGLLGKKLAKRIKICLEDRSIKYLEGDNMFK